MVKLWPWATKRSPESDAVVQHSIPLGMLENPEWPDQNFANYAYNGYQQSQIVHACIRERARAGTEPPLKLIKVNRDDEDEEIYDHPLMELLESPAPHMSQADFLEMFHIFLPVAGNVWMHKLRARNGGVVQLNVLRPDRVRVIPGRNTGEINGYAYRMGHDDGGQEVGVHADDIGHLKNPNPLNEYYGLPDIAPLAKIINIDDEITNFIKTAFKNKGVMAGWLTVKEAIRSQEQANEIRRGVYQRFQGEQGWHQMGILSGGATYQAAASDQIVGAMTDLRHTIEARICGVLGVSPMLISAESGMASNTYANYAEARRAFMEETVIPVNSRISRFLSRTLLPEFGLGPEYKIEFDYSAVDSMTENLFEVAQRVNVLFAGGIITLNEARQMVGQDPMEHDGDVRRIPIAVDEREDGEEEPEPQPFPMLPGGFGSEEEEDEDSPPDDSDVMGKEEVEADDESKSASKNSSIDRLQRRTYDAYATQLEQQLEKRFAAQARYAMGVIGRAESLEGKVDGLPFNADSLIPESADEELATLIRSVLGSLSEATWTNADALLGEQAMEAGELLIQDALREASERVVGINRTTREALNTMLEEGVGRGYSLRQIARGVPNDEFPGVRSLITETYKNRSQAIARTEVQIAQNKTTAARYKTAGVTMVRITDGDDDAECAAVNGSTQTVEWYAANPSAHPNCTRSAEPLFE